MFNKIINAYLGIKLVFNMYPFVIDITMKLAYLIMQGHFFWRALLAEVCYVPHEYSGDTMIESCSYIVRTILSWHCLFSFH